jgi:hypothetical protein
MKTIVKYSTIIALLFAISSCNSETESIKYSNTTISSSKRYVSDAKLHSYVFQELDTCKIENENIFHYKAESESRGSEIKTNLPLRIFHTNPNLIIKLMH